MHHIDIHVSDLRRTRPLLDALFASVGYRLRSEREGFVSYWKDGRRPSIGFLEGDCIAGSTQLAFAVASQADVDAAARSVAASSAVKIDGPALCPEYGDEYYAVFFEDADGNRYEVMHDPE